MKLSELCSLIVDGASCDSSWYNTRVQSVQANLHELHAEFFGGSNEEATRIALRIKANWTVLCCLCTSSARYHPRDDARVLSDCQLIVDAVDEAMMRRDPNWQRITRVDGTIDVSAYRLAMEAYYEAINRSHKRPPRVRRVTQSARFLRQNVVPRRLFPDEFGP